MDQNAAMMQFFPLIVLFVLMYFIVIRPQKKQQLEHQKMLDALAKGDKVVMSSGVHGLVMDLDKETIVIRLEDNVRARFDRAAVARKVKSE
jgi:preprotein translocase subunit YajC